MAITTTADLPDLKIVAIGRPWVETEGVVSRWFVRHACVAALLRPDNYVYGIAEHGSEIAPLLAELTTALAT